MTLMKTLTRLIAATATLFSVGQSYANDGAYYMSGNQLIPMQATDISLAQELLRVNYLEAEGVFEVNVQYTLENHGDPQSLLVGFEALPPGGDVDGFPVNGEHPYMQDFSVVLNGETLDYDVALVPMLYEREDADSVPFYMNGSTIESETEAELRAREENSNDVNELYVYYFDADFVAGKNTIEHTYLFDASSSIGSLFEFDYVLTAVNRWGDGGVGDFTLELDLGDLVQFEVLPTFFEGAKDWTIKGKGKIFDSDQSLYYRPIDGSGEGKLTSTIFAIHDGIARFTQKDFTPEDELYLLALRMADVGERFDAAEDSLSLGALSFPFMFGDGDLAQIDDFSRKVLRNYPFARRGYVFKDDKVQEYYDNEQWYIRDESYQPDLIDLSDQERALIKALK